MKKPELIFIPAPGVGHVISALEFAARLLGHDPRVYITVLAIKAPFNSHLDAYTKSLVASQPRVTLIDLPHVDLPPPELLRSVEHYFTVYIESYIPHVQRVVGEIQRSRAGSGSDRSVAGFVLDFFCTSMMDVAAGFSLPSYIYLTSNAHFLGLMFHLPARHDQVGREVRLSDPDLPLPGFTNPVPVSVLPSAVLDGEAGGYAAYVKLARRFRDARGIMVNTFKELEPFAVSSFSRGSSDGPAVYAVGPVIDPKGVPDPSLDRAHWEKIREWLDEQPPSSVVFLCFGSMGRFDADQVKEIAAGIERSGHKFLWSLRPESCQEQLPDGFLERTRGRGVVCGWTPQVEVLGHAAIGGFVSHCGWNSILESLWHGVPIVTWPIYAEQQLNAFMMVKELGLAEELRLDYKGHGGCGHLVPAEEIERAVERLMGGGAAATRKKVKEMKEAARKAVKEGGSSYHSIGRLIQDFIKSIE
ncbi:UDP-glycosyltransferase 71K1-like [Syzygium oleosum]|uniref:UDP-glycosyltransferase 71K1-like n=1 Tax=Syzygium oleosum TaxID=219896 RepID=UPI0024BB336F|nr:UDP-glycosyltransferase 71K1-like [Syzygium oleosum]